MSQFDIKFKNAINSLTSYNSNEEAKAAIGVGRPYWAGANHDFSPAGRLLKVV